MNYLDIDNCTNDITSVNRLNLNCANFIHVAPSIEGHSVLWMRSLQDLLSDRVASLVVKRDFGSAKQYASNISLLPVNPSVAARLKYRVGIARTNPWHSFRRDFFGGLLKKTCSNVVLVHFLTLATDLSNAWNHLPATVLVYCHGYDVTWNARDSETGEMVHGAGYPECVRSLPNNVQFLANSSWTRNKLQSIGVENEKISDMPLGTKMPISNSSNIRPEIEPLVFLYLGRLIDCKGPVETIKAFHAAFPQGEEKLLIAGGGNLFEDCREAIELGPARNRIRLLGPVTKSQGEKLRAEADVFTQHNMLGEVTRQEEAFGVSLIEAMAMGLSVVTGQSGGVTDFIQDGVTGLLFPPGDIEAHAQSLQRLARSSELRATLGKQAQEVVRSQYSLEVWRTRLVDMIEKHSTSVVAS